MSGIRSRDTKCELVLRKALFAKGIKGYKLHYPITGHPGIGFVRKRIAIFCDSDFWHGKAGIPTSNEEYWRPKLEKNKTRDKYVNSTLKSEGWRVLRFTESEILKNVEKCVIRIQRALIERNSEGRLKYPQKHKVGRRV